MKPKLFFNWSSGKDSAFALFKLLSVNEFDVALLFTSVGKETKRISLHGISEIVLKEQAKQIGIPIRIMHLPASLGMEVYNELMNSEMQNLVASGFSHTAYGDIFLEDLKKYREIQLSLVGIKPVFPLWKINTKKIILEFLALGFKTIVVAANSKWFSEDFVGREVTIELIQNLPEEVDPCGENGEFHTFCFDGPIFNQPVDFELGGKLVRTYPDPLIKDAKVEFWFCDIILKKLS